LNVIELISGVSRRHLMTLRSSSTMSMVETTSVLYGSRLPQNQRTSLRFIYVPSLRLYLIYF